MSVEKFAKIVTGTLMSAGLVTVFLGVYALADLLVF